MFLIEAKGKVGLWQNAPQDDFIQFLPNYFGCSPEELSVRFIPDSKGKETLEFSKKENCRIELGGGKIKKFEKRKVKIVENIEESQTTIDDQGQETTQLVLVPKEKEIEEELQIEEIDSLPVVSSWPYEKQNDKLIFKGIQIQE